MCPTRRSPRRDGTPTRRSAPCRTTRRPHLPSACCSPTATRTATAPTCFCTTSAASTCASRVPARTTTEFGHRSARGILDARAAKRDTRTTRDGFACPRVCGILFELSVEAKRPRQTAQWRIRLVVYGARLESVLV